MSEYWSNGVATLHQADARAMPLSDASVHMCVTSPPYWGLRDYGLGQWQGGDAECGHEHRAKDRQKAHGLTDRLPGTAAYGGNAIEAWPNGVCGHCGAIQQAAGIGLEPTLGEWVANIVAVMREVRRVLRDDGTCWLNLGDSYAANGTTGGGGPVDTRQPEYGRPPSATGADSVRGRKPEKKTVPHGLQPKSLIGQPWRVAFALQDDGWLLRSAIVWHKSNPMPESVRDRPTNAYEMIFLLAKQGRYFYDAEAVREPYAQSSLGRYKSTFSAFAPEPNGRRGAEAEDVVAMNPNGANARNVWSIPTQGRPDAHFATYPDELPRRCILAGTSERGVCADCGAPWVRIVERTPAIYKDTPKTAAAIANGVTSTTGAKNRSRETEPTTQTLGWQPTCGCNADTVPATVLDPFAGSGTTLAVAQALGRQSVGLDLNPEYLEIAKRYINRADGITLPMALA